jgi:N utilization substance protein B
MNLRSKGREIALQVLYAVDLGRNSVADAFLLFRFEPPVALEFALQLVQGTISSLEEIDSVIKLLLKNWEFERLNAVDKEILRLTIYEVEHVSTDEAGAVVYSAVELAKKYGDVNSPDFVNGILRSFLRIRDGERAS